MPAHRTPDPPHGQRAMYQRHIARNETPCPACRAAHAEYHRQYAQRLRQQHSITRTIRWEQLEAPRPMTGRAYDRAAYRRRRARLTAQMVDCWRGCGRTATTIGHVPPLAKHHHRHGTGCCAEPPECGPCNYGEGGRITAATKKAAKLHQSRRW